MTDSQVEAQVENNAEGVQKLTDNKSDHCISCGKIPHFCLLLQKVKPKPLKIGLFQDLAEALKDDERISKTQLRQALRQYTSNWRYLHGCREGAERVDLYGNPAGVLDAEHVSHAVQQLAEAKAKFAEKRKAELAAKKAQQKRPARKPNSNQATRKPKAPQVKLSAVDFTTLSAGSKVKVKVAEQAKNATVLNVEKDGARVELENGLVMTITADRLFA